LTNKAVFDTLEFAQFKLGY